MKNVLILILLFAGSMAFGQSQFTQQNRMMICGPFDQVLKALREDDIREEPIWIGVAENKTTRYSLFVNRKTGAFTIIHHGKEIGCILGIGYESELLIQSLEKIEKM